eukprot:SAG22_NODE_342_length_11973_cov_10.127927_9_plen_320_part_00
MVTNFYGVLPLSPASIESGVMMLRLLAAAAALQLAARSDAGGTDDGPAGTKAELRLALERDDLDGAEVLLRRLRSLRAQAERQQPPPAASTTPLPLPLLFMDPADLVQPWGKQELVATPASNISGLYADCDFSAPGLKTLVQGGLLVANPLRPAAGFELFFSSPSTLPHLEPGGGGAVAPPAPPPSKILPRGPLFSTDLQKVPGSKPYNESFQRFANKTEGALACQQRCDGDARCESWIYVNGEAAAGSFATERCCKLAQRTCPASGAQFRYCTSGAKVAGACRSGVIDAAKVRSIYFMTTPVRIRHCLSAVFPLSFYI